MALNLKKFKTFTKEIQKDVSSLEKEAGIKGDGPDTKDDVKDKSAPKDDKTPSKGGKPSSKDDKSPAKDGKKSDSLDRAPASSEHDGKPSDSESKRSAGLQNPFGAGHQKDAKGPKSSGDDSGDGKKDSSSGDGSHPVADKHQSDAHKATPDVPKNVPKFGTDPNQDNPEDATNSPSDQATDQDTDSEEGGKKVTDDPNAVDNGADDNGKDSSPDAGKDGKKLKSFKRFGSEQDPKKDGDSEENPQDGQPGNQDNANPDKEDVSKDDEDGKPPVANGEDDAEKSGDEDGNDADKDSGLDKEDGEEGDENDPNKADDGEDDLDDEDKIDIGPVAGALTLGGSPKDKIVINPDLDQQPSDETMAKAKGSDEQDETPEDGAGGFEDMKAKEAEIEAGKASGELDADGKPIEDKMGPDGLPLDPNSAELGPDGKPLPQKGKIGPDGKPLPVSFADKEGDAAQGDDPDAEDPKDAFGKKKAGKKVPNFGKSAKIKPKPGAKDIHQLRMEHRSMEHMIRDLLNK